MLRCASLSFDLCTDLQLPEPLQNISSMIPMTSSHWHPVSDKPDVQFVRKEGFPHGVILLKSGDLALNELSFRGRTIEFDIKPLAEDIPGIRFRRRDPSRQSRPRRHTVPGIQWVQPCKLKANVLLRNHDGAIHNAIYEHILSEQAAVAIMGSRQVGKTTLAREIADRRPASFRPAILHPCR